MKQVIFTSRLTSEPSAPATVAPSHASASGQPSLLSKVQAARRRHSACGVSSLIVRQGDLLLGALEGGRIYVDRMIAALANDGLLDQLNVLIDRPLQYREYSEVALSLIEAETLTPRPTWAGKDFATLDLRAAKRILKGLRAFHGLHAEPARESHLRSVQVGPLRA